MDWIDTFGQVEFDRLRPFSYPNTDFFVVAFDICHRDSFENVSNKWISELMHHCPSAHMILIGTKKDEMKNGVTVQMMKRRGLAFVSYEEGVKLACLKRFICYVETSAVEDENASMMGELIFRLQ